MLRECPAAALLFSVLTIAVALVAVQPAFATGGRANGKIAFVSGTPGSYDIYTMNSDRSGQAQLTSAPGDDLDPVWSPDGTKIAFASDRDGRSASTSWTQTAPGSRE